MPRRDLFHNNIKDALIKEGWLITDDPLDLTIGEVELLADLGAERVIAAERDNEKIAVEIKSFEGQSPVSEFHRAVGQYENYRLSLEELEPDRRVCLAIPDNAWQKFFQRPFIQKAIKRFEIEIIVFNPETDTITAWIK